MDIVVCIKQVPETNEIGWDSKTGTLIRESTPGILNPNDKNAIEAALQLRERHGGLITAISMGPPQAEDALREALGMGADKAILLSDRKFDPMKFIKVVEEEKITVIWAIPTIVHALNSLPQEVKDKHKWSSVRTFTTSGATFLTETQNDFTKQWPHIPLHSTYSATEVYFTNLRPEDQDRKVRCVGPAVFGMEIKLMDKEGNEPPPGELGVVYAKGISLFKGYSKNPEADKKTFRGDWFTCEDMGYLDEEGYLYLVDRAKDMIISGGENVASVEVENILLDHSAISECAVIGVPDEKWGERVHAVVSLHPGQEVSPEEIMDWCKDKMAGFKRPRSAISFLNSPKALWARYLSGN